MICGGWDKIPDALSGCTPVIVEQCTGTVLNLLSSARAVIRKCSGQALISQVHFHIHFRSIVLD